VCSPERSLPRHSCHSEASHKAKQWANPCGRWPCSAQYIQPEVPRKVTALGHPLPAQAYRNSQTSSRAPVFSRPGVLPPTPPAACAFQHSTALSCLLAPRQRRAAVHNGVFFSVRGERKLHTDLVVRGTVNGIVRRECGLVGF